MEHPVRYALSFLNVSGALTCPIAVGTYLSIEFIAIWRVENTLWTKMYNGVRSSATIGLS